MELAQLRDYVAYAERRTAEDKRAQVTAGAKKVASMSNEQISGAIKQYLAWRRRKRGLGPQQPI